MLDFENLIYAAFGFWAVIFTWIAILFLVVTGPVWIVPYLIYRKIKGKED